MASSDSKEAFMRAMNRWEQRAHSREVSDYSKQTPLRFETNSRSPNVILKLFLLSYLLLSYLFISFCVSFLKFITLVQL
jgi:hypothetical protein